MYRQCLVTSTHATCLEGLVLLTYLLRQMINADVDGSPAGFLGIDVLPLVDDMLGAPFNSGCMLFFFLAIVFVYKSTTWEHVAQ